MNKFNGKSRCKWVQRLKCLKESKLVQEWALSTSITNQSLCEVLRMGSHLHPCSCSHLLVPLWFFLSLGQLAPMYSLLLLHPLMPTSMHLHLCTHSHSHAFVPSHTQVTHCVQFEIIHQRCLLCEAQDLIIGSSQMAWLTTLPLKKFLVCCFNLFDLKSYFGLHFLIIYVSRFVSVGDALGRERPVTPMSSSFAGHSRCTVT